VLAAIWPAQRGASLDPAIVLRGTSSVERSRLPYVRLAVLGVVAMAVGSFLPHPSPTVAMVGITLAVVGAALTTPAVVVFVRRLVVAPVEALLGLPARLGLDYVERTLGRSTVNVLALMVAVSVGVSVGGWISSFERSVGSWFEQMSVADLSVTSGSPLLDRRHMLMNASVADRVREVRGVMAVQRARMIDQALPDGSTFRLVATDTDSFVNQAGRHGKTWPLVEGRPIEPGDMTSAPRIILGESAARRFGLRVGDRMKLDTTTGPVDFEVRAVVVEYTSERGAGFIDETQYREHWGDDAIDSVAVYVDPAAKVDTVAADIRKTLGGAGAAIFVTETETVRHNLLDSLEDTFSYSRAVEIITLFIALMGVIGTMIAAVMDRAREIGMLRAIGATSRQVAASILVESSFLGFCAVVAGIGLGVLQCLLFLKTVLVVGTGWHLDFVFPWASAARISALVLVTSGLSGALPAFRAAKTDITSAVLYE
jgi:putative ABC transport system permease protein